MGIWGYSLLYLIPHNVEKSFVEVGEYGIRENEVSSRYDYQNENSNSKTDKIFFARVFEFFDSF